VLPLEICNLNELTPIKLCLDKLSVLLHKMGDLTKLMFWNLTADYVSRLKPAALTKLTLLGLDGNQLTALPPEIAKLTKLTALSLNGNQLTELPPEIGKLTNLDRLWLGDNRLTTYPQRSAT